MASASIRSTSTGAPCDGPWVLDEHAVKGRHAELCTKYNVEGLSSVSSWGDTFDRRESWRNVRHDYDAETWVLDCEVEALVFNLKQMGILR